jgi:hypothetical protein
MIMPQPTIIIPNAPPPPVTLSRDRRSMSKLTDRPGNIATILRLSLSIGTILRRNALSARLIKLPFGPFYRIAVY